MPLDRYATPNANFVLVARLHSGPSRAKCGRRHWQPAKDVVRYQGRSPGWFRSLIEGATVTRTRFWIVGPLVAVALLPSPALAQRHSRGGEGRSHGEGRSRSGVVVAPRTVVSRPVVVSPRHYAVGRPVVPVRVIRPFYQPYYTFRPRFSIGFGFYVGQPVPYPYGYVYPYVPPYGYYGYPGYSVYGAPAPYGPPPPAYGYPGYIEGQLQRTGPGYSSSAGSAVAPIGAASGVVSGDRIDTSFGGVSFDISPASATVYVDGESAGTVTDFSATRAPLTLSPGEHHIDIVAPGYRTMSFDVTTNAGEVIPYKGDLEALPGR